MCMRTIKCLGALLLGALSAVPVMAQQTYEEMEQLTRTGDNRHHGF